MPKRLRGGCEECGGICGGAMTPRELMEMVLQHAEDGNISGGEVAHAINEYSGMGMHGEGFFSDFLDGLKKGFSAVVKPAGAILSAIPGFQAPGAVLSTLGNLAGGRRRVVKPRRRVVKQRKKTQDNL